MLPGDSFSADPAGQNLLQILQSDRFQQDVVKQTAFFAVPEFGVRGGGDYDDVLPFILFPYLLRQLISIHLRHTHVSQNDIRSESRNQLQRHFSVACQRGFDS